jgi:hypothetical protein
VREGATDSKVCFFLKSFLLPRILQTWDSLFFLFFLKKNSSLLRRKKIPAGVGQGGAGVGRGVGAGSSELGRRVAEVLLGG